ALRAGRFEPACGYGGRRLIPQPLSEDAPVDPRNVYAATKLHQEHLAQAFARETGIPVTALRYHNVYGPRMPRDTPYAGVAALFADALARGRAPTVFEDGAEPRESSATARGRTSLSASPISRTTSGWPRESPVPEWIRSPVPRQGAGRRRRAGHRRRGLSLSTTGRL